MRIKCPACGFSQEIDESSIPAAMTMATCPECGNRFRFRALPESESEDFILDEQAASAPGERSGESPRPEALGAHPQAEPESPLVAPEWEQTMGPATFFRTTLAILRNPAGFFSTLDVSGGYLRPTLFLILSFVPCAFALPRILPAMLASIAAAAPESAGVSPEMMKQASLFAALLMPFIYALSVLAQAGIIHLFFLLFFQPAQRKMEATFRARAYACGAVVSPLGLALLLCSAWSDLTFTAGVMFGGVAAYLFYSVTALRLVQRISTGAAFAALAFAFLAELFAQRLL